MTHGNKKKKKTKEIKLQKKTGSTYKKRRRANKIK